MIKKPTFKKLLKYIGIPFLVLLIINFALVLVMRAYLPQIIEKNNDSAYHLEFSKIGFSIFNGSFSLKKVKLVAKADASIEKDIDLLGTVEEIQVTGVNFYSLLVNQNLDASTIYINQPNLTILKQAEKKSKKSTPKKFTNKIDINKISVQKANITYASTDGQQKLQQLFNLNILLKGIHMGEYTIGKNIPFTYDNYNISIDSVYSNLNEIHHIKTGEILVDNNDFFMSEFKIIPEVNKESFAENEFDTNTRLNLSIPKLHLKGTDWGFDTKDDFYVKVGGIYVDSIALKILDQKQETVFKKAKEKASNIIQPLVPFPITIDEIDIKRAAFNSTNTIDLKQVHVNIKKISNKIHEKLIIDNITLANANITHNLKSKKNKNVNNYSQESGTKLNDEIIINNFEVKNAKYILHDLQIKKNIITVNNFNLNVLNTKVNDTTVKQKIPFNFEKLKLKTGNLHYDTGEFYDITSNGVSFENKKFEIDNLEMKSKFSRNAHVSKLKYANDIYTIKTGKITLDNLHWFFDHQNIFNLETQTLTLNTIHCNIFRSTLPPTKVEENHMYSKKLREIPFGLAINNVKIINSHLEYEEVDQNSISPGKLTFANFNATIANVFSGYNKKSLPNTTVTATTKFMNTSNLNANWQFNILNKKDAFTIKGLIQNFPAKAMNPFIKPYIKVGVDGDLNKIYFNFKGDNAKANGIFGINYRNLSVKFFDKNGKENKKMLSKITNLLITNENKDTNKQVDIWDVQRKKECSFFNYLWLCVLQGLKQTLVSNTIKI